ncbi:MULTISPECIES: ABC transporter ATP-binding protein [unclassified Streptococcus]|uniref:ABC transporter ATP-binding protein n=1 Tax=unclassified Streptococcus TaxID=2608887 RepID=UPI0010724C61|nr:MULTISPECIES: ABC transporter ATP-binding protein [unclassified Streptococcus]MBF0787879.1 ABC transporter ATP-binding protein [Streptococcus sp. 19428wC2_LYSM12]MCQ9211163.1 ABC transporter ATP-binding protein [Streptococcus sp. B01]MCQ9214438.1 ABC transporter ATP-binding protein [Streptococcus sp. O1]TFV05128.1 ABC transporter ATP-binding protein [Streptococcus sp. LYSM12]
MKKAIIEFENFSFKYHAQQDPTLYEIDLTIYQGEKVLIVGPSGSGKSTLGQCLNGIIPNIYPGTRTGSLRIDGKDAFEQSIYEKSLFVSTVLQDTDGQFIGLSVAEDLAFALENDVTPLEEMKTRIHSWAERLDLQALLSHRPQDLSGGQKQRVSLAGVLIDESPILLFDEPLANLDPRSGQDTIELIDRLHKEQGTTTIIIEHRLEDVLYRQVDRIVLISEGRILYNGEPDALLRSDLLRENGIREPLYVTTLRQLDYDLDKEADVTSIEQLTLTDVQVGELPALVVEEKLDRSLIEVQHLCVSYGDKEVLKDIHFSIRQGERLAIIGKNGAGKSTLAKALCQFVEVSGDILWNGQSILSDSIKERAERIGYVLQNPNQMISQTMIFDEVALGLRLRGVAEADVTEKVEAVLRTCGLYAFRKWPISALSFGQKKRVTIASILVLNPEIILLDEPTAGQDQRNYTEIMNFLDELNRQGHTIIMITHDMQLMLDYSDRAIVLVDGQIVDAAHPASVLTAQSLIEAANLKETSIFHLAKKLGVDALALTRFYMERERKE